MNEKDEVGALAEELVARWLVGAGYEVLHRRWHCRWGELDLVAQRLAIAPQSRQPQISLAFVEVKARSKGNWDANGLLSITLQKQKKLWQAAELFLSTYPELAEYPCRFDVALVSYWQAPSRSSASNGASIERSVSSLSALPSFEATILGERTRLGNYYLTLHDYMQGAFEQPY